MSALDETQRAAEAQFSRQSQRYAKGHILENVEDVREAAADLDLPARARVLDVACGAGHTGLYFASLGHDVTCADLTAAMLDRTREAAAARGLVITTSQHPAETMPHAEATFDLVTCRVAPHHFTSPAAFVREVARVLRSGGAFLLIDGTVPDDDAVAADWLNRVEKLRDPSHARLLPPREWIALCTEAGLSVARHWLRRKKQPNLEWYFETAATTPENRRAVLDLLATAPFTARAAFDIAEEKGQIVWEWPMLLLIARRGGQDAGN